MMDLFLQYYANEVLILKAKVQFYLKLILKRLLSSTALATPQIVSRGVILVFSCHLSNVEIGICYNVSRLFVGIRLVKFSHTRQYFLSALVIVVLLWPSVNKY